MFREKIVRWLGMNALFFMLGLSRESMQALFYRNHTKMSCSREHRVRLASVAGLPRALEKEVVECESIRGSNDSLASTAEQLGYCSFSVGEWDSVSQNFDTGLERLAFHLSISSCCLLYCLSNSSSTFFKPSRFVCNAGVTSFTVRSTSTPFIIRKHLRSGGSGPRVSRTSLQNE